MNTVQFATVGERSDQFLHYSNGSLTFKGSQTSLQSLTSNYSKPLMVYNLGLLRARCHQMRTLLKVDARPVNLFYAMKANANLKVLEALRDCGLGVDVVSGGEIDCALRAGFSPLQMVYSGVGKTRAEIQKAIEIGILQINVESIPELERISQIATALKKTANVAVRLNPNIDIKTHPYIATGLRDNKFGIEMSALPSVERVVLNSGGSLKLVGVSLHLGSMMLEFDGLRQALRLLRPQFESLQLRFPSVTRLDFGGGLGVIYDRQALTEEQDLLQRYSQVIQEELSGLNADFQSEPGRWLVAHTGVLISQLQYVKHTSHKIFYILDSGMNHLLRPSLYGAYHAIYPLSTPGPLHNQQLVDVVGPICESSDFFAKNIKLPEMLEGDFLVIADVGAYGFSMASNYNQHELPLEICIE